MTILDVFFHPGPFWYLRLWRFAVSLLSAAPILVYRIDWDVPNWKTHLLQGLDLSHHSQCIRTLTLVTWRSWSRWEWRRDGIFSWTKCNKVASKDQGPNHALLLVRIGIGVCIIIHIYMYMYTYHAVYRSTYCIQVFIGWSRCTRGRPTSTKIYSYPVGALASNHQVGFDCSGSRWGSGCLNLCCLQWWRSPPVVETGMCTCCILLHQVDPLRKYALLATYVSKGVGQMCSNEIAVIWVSGNTEEGNVFLHFNFMSQHCNFNLRWSADRGQNFKALVKGPFETTEKEM